MTTLYSFGIGIGTKNSNGQWLEVFYPSPILRPSQDLSSIITSEFGDNNEDIEPTKAQLDALESALAATGYDDFAELIRSLKTTNHNVVAVVLLQDSAPTSVPQAYLKLHLLSHRLVKPHHTNISGIFGVLKNIAWTNIGPIDLNELPERLLAARKTGDVIQVDCVDKFPKMVDYIVPSGIRIADTSRVRLGAYVGEGTTVMHEGFINFNAGTEGPNMIEGRVSAGVFCGAGSDIGGGASIMGTLSGGGKEIISLGKKCLLGANAGLGISLGNDCVIEAGLYITSGTVVTLLDDQKVATGTCKAKALSGQSNLLFRRNSINGAVQCLTNKTAIELNDELHSSN